MNKGLLEVVVGGQYGSEGKGAVAAHLGRGRSKLAAVRVAGPNAGHSALDAAGRKWALRQIPVVAVTNLEADLVIGAGSEIDPNVLEQEIRELEAGGIPIVGRLYVDNQATIIEPEDKAREMGGEDQHGAAGLTASIGSTGKGVGAARARRAVRDARTWADGTGDETEWALKACDTTPILQGFMRGGGDVLLEGTQGYALGTHAGHYPYCTSSDCRAIDFLSMAGLSPWADSVHRTDVWVVLRTYPIRVAGPSGPLKDETTWERLADESDGYIAAERTTVTKKIRRVGAWDSRLAREALEANGGAEAVRVALTFFDYWFPELSGMTTLPQANLEAWNKIREIEHELGTEVELLGTGPGTVIDLRGS